MFTNKESVETLKAGVLVDSSVSSKELFVQWTAAVCCRTGLSAGEIALTYDNNNDDDDDNDDDGSDHSTQFSSGRQSSV